MLSQQVACCHVPQTHFSVGRSCRHVVAVAAHIATRHSALMLQLPLVDKMRIEIKNKQQELKVVIFYTVHYQNNPPA